MTDHQNGHATHELPGICQLLSPVRKKIRRQGVPNAATNAQQREEVRME